MGDESSARPLTATEYRLLVEHSPVMIWRAGLDTSCDYFNETWLEFTGRTLQEELGEGWAQGVHPDDVARCVDYYLDHFKRRAPFEMEYRLRRHDGVFRWIFDRGVPFHDDAGQFAGFIGSCIDVDDRRRAHEARQRHDETRLAVAQNFENRILAVVSHDIRNPLGAIQLAARHLQRAAGQSEVVQRDAERITRGVERIQRIVADLLDLSRERHGGGIPIVRELTDLRAVCQQVIDELEAAAKDRCITFECDADAAGLWDKHRIIQAISNLTSNAIQHGVAGTPIRVRLTAEAACVVVEVHNQGTIPADLLPVIFDPFRSGGDPAVRGQGLGLGLFIAKAIARAHDGRIEVASTPEAGTTFRFILPRCPAPGTAATA